MATDNQYDLSGLFTILEEEIRARESLVKEHAAQLAEKQKAIKFLVSQLEAKVKQGETTGNRIRDLVLRVHGYNPFFEERYATLEARLKGKGGEFILIFFEARIAMRYHGMGMDERLAVLYRLGVLEGEELLLKDGLSGTFIDHATPRFTLPVSRYIGGEAEVKVGVGERDVVIVPQNIFARDSVPHYKNPCFLDDFLKSNSDQFGIVVGDEAVREWLENKHYMIGLFKSAADVLSKLILEPPLL